MYYDLGSEGVYKFSVMCCPVYQVARVQYSLLSAICFVRSWFYFTHLNNWTSANFKMEVLWYQLMFSACIMCWNIWCFRRVLYVEIYEWTVWSCFAHVLKHMMWTAWSGFAHVLKYTWCELFRQVSLMCWNIYEVNCIVRFRSCVEIFMKWTVLSGFAYVLKYTWFELYGQVSLICWNKWCELYGQVSLNRSFKFSVASVSINFYADIFLP